MSVLKCEICGGTMVLDDDGEVAICEYCGTRQALNTDVGAPNNTPKNKAQIDAVRIENERRKFAEANARAQEAQLERERMAQQNRNDKVKRNKAGFKKFLIVSTSLVLAIVLIIISFTTIIPKIRYSGALKDIESGNYNEAYDTLKDLDGFEDSGEQLKELLNTHPDLAQVGDTLYFGTYEQDNNLSNGKEKIEWIVLDKGSDGKLLLISRYALDCRSYSAQNSKITWEDSGIRKWLNSEFFQTAFEEKERATVETATLLNKSNPEYKTEGGKDTKDRIFLLSIEEARRYFPTQRDRICKATKYAEAQGSQIESLTSSCRWWLRSPGATQYNASFVKVDGLIFQTGVSAYREKRSVRPAMWVKF